MPPKDKRDVDELEGFRGGPLAWLGGQSTWRMKRGCGNGVLGLGERGGGISLKPPAAQSGVTEKADASQRYVAKGQAATVASRSKGKSDEMQGIMVVFTVTIFRD